jgi:hypothetical protein
MHPGSVARRKNVIKRAIEYELDGANHIGPFGEGGYSMFANEGRRFAKVDRVGCQSCAIAQDGGGTLKMLLRLEPMTHG